MKRLSLILFVTIALTFSNSFAQSSLELGKPMFAQSDQAKIAYWTLGEGEPILLVHGFLGRARNWSTYLEPLLEKHQVILVELRGHGFSTNEKAYYSNKDAGGDLLAVLNEIGASSVDAVGFSAGSAALLNLALLQPTKLKSLAIIGGYAENGENARNVFRSFHPDSIDQTMMKNITADHEQGEQQTRALLGYLQDFAEDKESIFTQEQLVSISTPTLVISGDRDVVIPLEQALQLNSAIPNSYLMIFPNTGHSKGPADFIGQEYLISTLLGFFSESWKCPAFCDN